MRLDRALLLAFCGASLLSTSSCLFGSTHERCHRRALQELGCCPFHGEECEGASFESIKKQCAAEVSALSPVEATETGDVADGVSDEDADETTAGPQD